MEKPSDSSRQQMPKGGWMNYELQHFIFERCHKYDRMVYDVYDEVVEVLVIELEGHYNDK